MTFQMKYKITADYLPKGTNRRSGTKAKPIKFIVLHDVGNDGYNATTKRKNGTTARNNVSYYKNSPTISASAHTFIDNLEIIECVPATTAATEKAWHVLYNKTIDNKMFGVDANDAAIGVELCYFPEDKAKSTEAYKKFVWYCAYLAYYFKLNPANCFVGHETLDPGRKVDPTNGLKWIGKTTAQCMKDIQAEYNACQGKATAPAAPALKKADRANQTGIATIVQKEPLNVREQPDPNSELVKTLPSGTSWRVYETKNGFYKVGINQWISANSIRTRYEALLPMEAIGQVTIVSDTLNVRADDKVNSTLKRTVAKGSKHAVFKIGSWGYKLEHGWVSKGDAYVSFVKA